MNDNDLLTVTMPAGKWNCTLALLRLAQDAVGEIIGEIRQQCLDSAKPAAPTPNGEDAHAPDR